MMDSQPTSQKENNCSCPPGCCPDNRWFKPAAIILGILIVIGLFGNIYLLLQKPKSSEQSKILPTPTTTQVIVTPTLTAPTLATNETANWKTYRNDKYKYEVKYPEGVKIEEGSGYDERIQETILTLFGPKYQGPGEFTDGFGITLAVVKNLNNKTPNQFAQENYEIAQEDIKSKILEGDISKCKVENVAKSNVTGARFTYCTQAPGSGILNFSEWYARNGIAYQIYAVLQNGDYLTVFDQILSTFRFLP